MLWFGVILLALLFMMLVVLLVGVGDDGDFHFATYIGEHHLHHHNFATYTGQQV